MQITFLAGAFLIAFFGSVRSLGLGICALLAVGYFNGVIRANYLGVGTTLMFDAAILGLYLGRYRDFTTTLGERYGLRTWIVGILVMVITLFLIPIHDLLIQLVGARAEAYMVPLIILGSHLHHEDVRQLATGLSGLNLIALLVGAYLYQYGIESLYPFNQVTEIMYYSKDVAGGFARIPSTFLSAHAYGGCMIATLPIICSCMLDSYNSLLTRRICAAGAFAAILGLLMSACRSPFVILVCALLISLIRAGLSGKIFQVAVIILCLGGVLAASNERFQRFLTLSDREQVLYRVGTSANVNSLDIILLNPFGSGMGAGAPSIPYFLRDRAPTGIATAENEFVRLSLDCGWPGIALWVGFVLWILSRKTPYRVATFDGVLNALSYGFVAASWLTAFIGTGLLVSIPSSSLMLLQMGLLSRAPTLVGSKPSLLREMVHKRVRKRMEP